MTAAGATRGSAMSISGWRPAMLAAAIAAAAAATILGAYFFQYVVGLSPCPLCLEQRIPYYLAIPVAAAVAFVAANRAPVTLVRLGFGLLVLILLVGAGLGVYHAGIEWKFWPGPAECTGELGKLGGGMVAFKGVVITGNVPQRDKARANIHNNSPHLGAVFPILINRLEKTSGL